LEEPSGEITLDSLGIIKYVEEKFDTGVRLWPEDASQQEKFEQALKELTPGEGYFPV
jgi:glutathione S-transferase